MDGQVPQKRTLLGRKPAAVVLRGDVVQRGIGDVGVPCRRVRTTGFSHCVGDGSPRCGSEGPARAGAGARAGGGAVVEGSPRGADNRLIGEFSPGRGGDIPIRQPRRNGQTNTGRAVR